MYEVLDTKAFAELVTFSAQTFERFGFDVDLGVTGHRGAEPPVLLDAAVADGFTDALVLPPAAWQQAHLARLAAAFATGVGWERPYVEVDGLAPLRRPAGAYVLLLRPDPRTDDDLRGLTAPGLRRALGGEACLTLDEYLVVQRTMFERFGDHRFDDYSADPSGWMWLADSADGQRTAMAYWYGPKRRVEVAACKTGSKNPRKGARRCRVIPLHPLETRGRE